MRKFHNLPLRPLPLENVQVWTPRSFVCVLVVLPQRRLITLTLKTREEQPDNWAQAL
jgi:hypothetical protein